MKYNVWLVGPSMNVLLKQAYDAPPVLPEVGEFVSGPHIRKSVVVARDFQFDNGEQLVAIHVKPAV